MNGIVLAADGKKMSKSQRNYPDPVLVCDHHGADAVRLYLCNSPVVRAENLKFQGPPHIMINQFKIMLDEKKKLTSAVAGLQAQKEKLEGLCRALRAAGGETQNVPPGSDAAARHAAVGVSAA